MLCRICRKNREDLNEKGICKECMERGLEELKKVLNEMVKKSKK